MKVCFRVDASSFIGSGHIMRCIALAEELNTLGSDVEFITRNYQGNLNGHIKDKGLKLVR